MYISKDTIMSAIFALLVALVISFIATPPVRAFANNVGAIDVPNDSRRVHKEPIPRLGGLAIFVGFIISVLVFADITHEIQGILIGSTIIVFLGVIDDIIHLKAWQKLLVQIVAALVVVYHGVTIEIVSHPNIFSSSTLLYLNGWATPITVIWIVAITNAVNLIDGLDGLAVGVSTIASITLLVIAVLLTNSNAAIIFAALTGACIGFMPFNINPAKIFMGDTGALLLGFLLSTLSVMGLFKFYAIISFIVPFMALAMPIFDTTLAIFRRLANGKNPLSPDRGHLHHKLLDRGLNQKQAVFIIYVISGVMGMCAVLLTTRGQLRIVFTLFALVIAVIVGILITKGQILQHDDIRSSAQSPEDNEHLDESDQKGAVTGELEKTGDDIARDGGEDEEN